MNKAREESQITVTIPNLTGPLRYALDQFNLTDHPSGPALTMNVTGDPGYVLTYLGMFAFDSEGVGPNRPVTKDHPLELGIFPEWEDSFEVIPSGVLSLTDSDLLMLPAKEEVALERFIRSFGSRLEGNYQLWLDCLKRAKPMEMAEHG